MSQNTWKIFRLGIQCFSGGSAPKKGQFFSLWHFQNLVKPWSLLRRSKISHNCTKQISEMTLRNDPISQNCQSSSLFSLLYPLPFFRKVKQNKKGPASRQSGLNFQILSVWWNIFSWAWSLGNVTSFDGTFSAEPRHSGTSGLLIEPFRLSQVA